MTRKLFDKDGFDLTDEQQERLNDEYDVTFEVIDSVDDLEPSDTMGNFASVSKSGDFVPYEIYEMRIDEFAEKEYREARDLMNGLDGVALEAVVLDARSVLATSSCSR